MIPAAAAAAAKNPSGWWAASGAPPTVTNRYGRILTPEEAVPAVTIVRSYDVGAKIARAPLVDVPVAVDEVSSVGHLLRTALEHARVTRAPLPADQPMIHRVAGTSIETMERTVAAAGAELAAGSEAEARDPAADAAADALGADLNEGGRAARARCTSSSRPWRPSRRSARRAPRCVPSTLCWSSSRRFAIASSRFCC